MTEITRKYILLCSLLAFFSAFCALHATAQQYSTLTVPYKDKPEKYQDKEFKAEKSGDGKLKGWKSFTQGLYTHYNYLFNANLRLDELLRNSSMAENEDYTQLLPFYSYAPRQVAQSKFLDSVIEKSTAALLLHDLRNNWIDEVYLLLGKAFYYKGKLDTAEMHFQYLNYAFAPKDEGSDIPLASNINNPQEGEGTINIVSPEKKNILSHRPRRNEGLIWLIRVLTDEKKYNTAGGLIRLLSQDPAFPKSQQQNFYEAIAYWNYAQNQYDSAAFYLAKCTNNVPGRLEKSRRDFLTGQLFQKGGVDSLAAKYYMRSAQKTPSLLMEIYAQLYAASLGWNEEKNGTAVQQLDDLAQKNKYFFYRDLIYYLKAQYQLQQKDSTGAENSLVQGLHYGYGNSLQHSKSFYLLGQLEQHFFRFKNMANAYDSITSNEVYAHTNFDQLHPTFTVIGKNMQKITEQDSILGVGKMPQELQTAYLKKELRKIRKRLGLKEEAAPSVPFISNNLANGNTAATDLFSGQNTGEWYFNNNSLKSAGYQTFKQNFGNRPNADNWQRLSAIKNNMPQAVNGANISGNAPNQLTVNNSKDSSFLTVQDLRADLPLTEEAQNETLNKIAEIYFDNGALFQDKIGDYRAATYCFNKFFQMQHSSSKKEEALFRVVQCARLQHRIEDGDSALYALSKEYPNGTFLPKLKIPTAISKIAETSEQNAPTKEYARIYDLLISGQFEEAKNAKKIADTQYGQIYWTPQLLYIEAIYNVSIHHDSVAIKELSALKARFNTSPMAEKATTMIDVLSRRASIEKYLTDLRITKLEDDTTDTWVREKVETPQPAKDSIQEKEWTKLNIPSSLLTKDSVKGISKNIAIAKGNKLSIHENTALPDMPKVVANPLSPDSTKPEQHTIVAKQDHFGFNAADSQYVIVVLDRVAPVFVKEASNAFNLYNQKVYYNQLIARETVKINAQYDFILMGPFADANAASKYIDNLKPKLSTTVIAWLDTKKYHLSIISRKNMHLLLENKDYVQYQTVLHQAWPDKF